MKISLNSIRSFNKRYETTQDVAAIGVDALVEKIGAQLGAVENVEKIGEKYQGIVVAKVVSCKPIENSDHLNVCRIDDGSSVKNVERGDDGLVQVVCGAPNCREGLLVAWLPPGTTVPESIGKEPFVLEAREIRGQVSNGMLASLRELALGDSHDGIVELDDPFGKLKPGQAFAEVFELKDDVVLDIENKMFTHRPDCFGLLGISRELAGIQAMQFKSPSWYTPNAEIPASEAEPLALEVKNELPTLVPRFCAIALRDVKVGPSPVWLQIELAKVGLRSINNIVDYTNFFMLETGQPLHAYDYDKLKALDSADKATIVVRNPRANEKITLLNGKTLDPRQEAIMIASASQLIGVGGVMGGAETEVDKNTKNIVLEAATFDMYSIRRTSMAHGLFTDAVTRFNKGQSPLQNRAVIAKIVDEIRQFAGGKVASELVDLNELKDREWVHPPVPVDASFVNSRLGLDLSAGEMKKLLENVEFAAAVDGQTMTVTAPFWRTDIETREDVVEELGRLHGFDKLPLVLPERSVKPVAKDPLLESKSQIRSVLAKAGASEVLTYSFVHGDLLQKVGQDMSQAFEISNALSPDLQYYRLSLTPSLLEKVHPNIKAGYGDFALFEIGVVHGKSETDEDGLPKEVGRVALVWAADAKVAAGQYQGAPYYQARVLAVDLLKDYVRVRDLRFVPLAEAGFTEHKLFQQLLAPYDSGRSAVIMNGKAPLGVVGEFKPSVARALKLPAACSGFELFLSAFKQPAATSYVPLPRFPKVTQDITLRVPAELDYQTLYDFAWDELAKVQPEQTLPSLGLVDIFQRPDDTAHLQITLHFSIASYERTLTDTEVSKLLDTIAASAKTNFGAERV